MLPTLATAADVREVVQLLKKRPEGVAVVEVSDAIRKRLFDPRKIAAYELWGLVSKVGDRVRLSRLGRELATKLAPEAAVYRAIIDNTPPYRAVLEWVHRQNLDLITHADVVEYWRANFPEALRPGERTFEGQVVSFFHLCHAAEIGATTVGRKRQPSRLCVDRDELAAYLNGVRRYDSERPSAVDERPSAPRPAALVTAPPRLRVFISAPEGAGILDTLRDALGLVDIDSDAVERVVGGGELVPERTFKAIRRCDAGIIVLGSADCRRDAAGEDALDQSVLVEIGAACVHFARRLLLLTDGRLPLPFDTGDLRRYELVEGGLKWETGVRLIKDVKSFQSRLQSADA